MDRPSAEGTVKSTFKGIFAINGWILFAGLIALAIIDVFLRYKFILGQDEIYYQTFGDKVAMENIKLEVAAGREQEWVGYLIVPLTILLRILFAAFCLNIGALFFSKKVRFKQMFRIALVSDYAMVLKLLVVTLIFSFFWEAQNLMELGTFMPTSLLSLIGPENVDPYFHFPLLTLNLFEVAYWVMLAMGVRQVYQQSFGKSFGFVMKTYGIGLLIWMVFVVFMTINVMPGE